MALLEVKDLKVYYKTRRGINKAVDGISFEIDEGQSIGLVGESGCGKSTIARAIIRVMSRNAMIEGGEIYFQGDNILEYTEKKMRAIRWTEMAMSSYWPASMMGVGDKWGSIQPGLFADIIAVKGDVLRDIELLKRVDLVMKDGVIYKQHGQVLEARFK